MSEWQPIETAPHDGRLILAWGPCWSLPDIISWMPDHKVWQEGLQGDYVDDGWEPTHWMPLPAPPEAATVAPKPEP